VAAPRGRDRGEPSLTVAARARSALRTLIDAGAVGAAVVFIASYFPRAVMLAPTITSGGDMGSHYWPALYLREQLLPHGRVVGWCPGNYCGFPLFQFYFPLPFVLMAGLSLVIPLTVAFKLVSVLGTILTPVCSYFGLRLAGVAFPGPALGALASLCFVFMEANSMWGGNIPSTLAGEFTFSLSLALAFLFLGSLRYTMVHGRGRLGNALLVALIGMNHGYTLLWAGFTSLTELLVTQGWWRRVGTLIVVHGLGFLLMGFWLIPLLAYSPWTTAYANVWYINSWREILPPILWPAAGTAVATLVVLAIVCVWRRQPFPAGLAKVWAAILIAAFFYVAASALHVVDIRFIPFFQLGLCLAAAAGLGALLALLPGAEIWPLVGALTILPFVQSRVTFIPSWITWNYAGYERKAGWPAFRAVNEKLRGDFRDPRVVFEHSSDYEQAGTIRAFENLPLFSGRSTLEGLYMQGSPTAPFIFYTQSEVSKEQSCPFPNYGCSRIDFDRGLGHLRMFNVSHFVVRSQVVKGLAAAHPELVREASIPPYEIYRLTKNADRYAVPVPLAPILVLTSSWKEVAYRWFKRASPDGPLPVFAETVAREDEARFAAVVTELPRELPAKSLGPPPALEEHLETDRIVVTGCRPGYPVLVRVSYHPRWKALTGERVWLAAPSFMLVFPRGERVELVFDGGWPVTLGHVATVIGWVVLLVALLPVGRALGRWLAAPALALPPVPAVVALVRRTGTWTPIVRRTVLGMVLLAVVALLAVFAFFVRTSEADTLYRRGQRIYDAGRLREALPYFREAQQAAPLSNTAIHSTYYESIILYREEDWAEAEKGFRKLIERFPEAQAAAESQYHIGLCRARQGDEPGAIAAWRETRQRYPGTPWAGYAGERLAEHGAATP